MSYAPAPVHAVAGIAAHATDLSKVYGEGETRVVALDSVSVEFGRGQFTAIMGPSGSGKSPGRLRHLLPLSAT